MRNGQGTGLGMVWDYGLGKAFRQVDRRPEAGRHLGLGLGVPLAILPSFERGRVLGLGRGFQRTAYVVCEWEPNKVRAGENGLAIPWNGIAGMHR